MSFFSNKLKELRKDKGFNQTKVANAINVQYFTLGKWEQGRAEPSLDDLQKLADFFEVSIDYLVGRTEDEDNVVVISSDKSLTKEEERMLAFFRSCPALVREKLIEDAEYFAKNYDKILK